MPVGRQVKNFIIMETKVKTNGTATKRNATVKKEVQKKLTNGVIGKTVAKERKA